MYKHFFIINSQKIEIKQGNQIIGRAPDNDISIPESSISSKHLFASICSNIDRIEIMDLNSSNGTVLNGNRIPPLKLIKLNKGDKLFLGNLQIYYDYEEELKITSKTTDNLSVNKFMRGDVTVFAKFDPKEFSEVKQELSKIEIADLEEVKQDNKKLGFLYSFGQKIGNTLSINDLFNYILKEVFAIFTNADRALIFLNYNGTMRPEIFWEEGEEKFVKNATYSKTIVSMATQEKHAFIASDLIGGNDIEASQSIVLLNLQCTMIVPFIVENELYGLLQLDSRKNINAFTKDDLKMLSGICNQVAVNIKNKLLISEMHKQTQIRNSLERYLGPKMANHLIENKINLKQQGEERLVSILFSDIRGFTPLSEKLKPAEIIEILTIYFSRMTKIIFKYDGFIDKFIGDAIFCIFGIPLYQKNHADLAVQTALEMQKELAKMNEQIFIKKLNTPVNIGIGINTGKVVYGNVASMERPEVTIIGDTVNVSERLCSLAKPKQILISNEALKYVEKDYPKEKMGLLALKGKEEKVLVYSLVNNI